MSRVTFKQIASDQANIYDEDGDLVGEVFRHPDILNPGKAIFTAQYFDDPRGPLLVRDRSRVRDEAAWRYETHPLL